MARRSVIYTNPPIKNDKPRRESPQDFIRAFLEWKKSNPDRNVTPKAFAIIRNEKKEQKL